MPDLPTGVMAPLGRSSEGRRVKPMSRWRLHRFVRALRSEAHRHADPLGYLIALRERVRASGQTFGLIPGEKILNRAVKIEYRRARLRLHSHLSP
jgi:hypothetical protein